MTSVLQNFILLLKKGVLTLGYFILARIVSYRKSVIKSNIDNSFPNQSIQWKSDLIKEYYTNLVRYIMEIFSILIKSKTSSLTKIQFTDLLHWQQYIDNQKSCIVLASHIGNWEMNIVLLPSLINRKVIGFYKPLSSARMDIWMKKIRSRYGLELHPIEHTARIMMQKRNEKYIYIFLSDQSPVNMNGTYWNYFLHQHTPWMTGAQKLGIKFGYPILYLSQQPQTLASKHHYTLQLSVIDANPISTDGQEDHIIEKYTRIVESEIYTYPAFWLWSHRRWKRAHLFKPTIENGDKA